MGGCLRRNCIFLRIVFKRPDLPATHEPPNPCNVRHLPRRLRKVHLPIHLGRIPTFPRLQAPRGTSGCWLPLERAPSTCRSSFPIPSWRLSCLSDPEGSELKSSVTPPQGSPGFQWTDSEICSGRNEALASGEMPRTNCTAFVPDAVSISAAAPALPCLHSRYRHLAAGGLGEPPLGPRWQERKC